MNGVPCQPNRVPVNVCINISRAVRWRAGGEFTEAGFAAQLQRLWSDELEPNGLTLLIRHLEGGRIRVVVKEVETEDVRAMLDFAPDGTLEIGRFDPVENNYLCGLAAATA